ncbi:MAG: phosphoribosylformylglycinamidine synthase subunit PurS [Bdellovibrionota bacterium]
MKARVLVSLKDEVLDAGGRALAERLRGIGYTEVKDAKLGKFIELEIETGDREKEKERVDEMCRKLLANEMIEEYLVLPDEEAAKGPKK